MKAREIPVVSLEEFERLLSRDADLLFRQPCVIEGFIQSWPAYGTWQDLSYLDEKFGALAVTAGAPQFITHKHARICEVTATYSEYLGYIRAPDRAEEIFRGKWTRGGFEEFQALKRPLYCGSIRFIRDSADRTIDELRPLTPPSLECWNDEIPYYYQLNNHFWLYVGLKGALTPLHTDNNSVFAYLAQFKGTKRATLYSPEDRRHYFNKDVGYMDVLNPNPEEFPTWSEAEPWVATLRAGQMLIWGANWAHHVVTEEDAISTSLDIVNRANIREYAQSQEWMSVLGRFAKKNFELVKQRTPGGIDEIADEAEWHLGKRLMIRVLEAALQEEDSQRSHQIKTEMLRHLK
jgi:hypothetical protein